MRSWQDAAGNQCGRYEGSTPGLPALLLGSHLDTVPNAGRYDGILGVVLAIAVVSRLHASGTRLPFAIEVVAFGDEEGTRFGTALLGSRAVAGTWDEHWWEARGRARHDPRRGVPRVRPRPLADRHRRAGRRRRARLPRDAHRAGPVPRGGRPRSRRRLLHRGRAPLRAYSHRQGRPCGRRAVRPPPRRADGAAEAVLAVERIAREHGAIATVGRLEAFPERST